MEENAQEELVLALSEMLRQWRKLCVTEGAEVFSCEISSKNTQDIETLIKGFKNGQISVEQMEKELARRDHQLRQRARELGDPATIMSIDAHDEASAHHLAPAAALLISDATQSAGQGVSKERWIMEVLNHHEGDDAAQLACMRYVVALRSGGTWPWPRENNC